MASSTSAPPLGIDSPVVFSKDNFILRGVITKVNNYTYTIRITYSSALNPATGSGLAVGDTVDEDKTKVDLRDTNAGNNTGHVGGRRRRRKTSKKSKKSKRSRKSVRK